MFTVHCRNPDVRASSAGAREEYVPKVPKGPVDLDLGSAKISSWSLQIRSRQSKEITLAS